MDRLLDETAVRRIIELYGPLVDTGRAEEVAALWTPDGVYDVDGHVLRGRGEISAMVQGAAHQGLIARGCAHLISPHQIEVDGDVATARGYSQLVVREGGGFRIARVTANTWQFVRSPKDWLVSSRVARLVGPGGGWLAM